MCSSCATDQITEAAEALLRAGRWWSGREEPAVECPGCRSSIADGRTGSHAYTCAPLRALAESRP
jgi:hypothetical protein